MREILTQQSNDQKTNSAQDTNATIKQTRKQVVREWYNQVINHSYILNHSYIGPDTSENTVAKSQIVLVLYALVWEG